MLEVKRSMIKHTIFWPLKSSQILPRSGQSKRLRDNRQCTCFSSGILTIYSIESNKAVPYVRARFAFFASKLVDKLTIKRAFCLKSFYDMVKRLFVSSLKRSTRASFEPKLQKFRFLVEIFGLKSLYRGLFTEVSLRKFL